MVSFTIMFTCPQRVLNDLYRTRLSYVRMTRLLGHPLPLLSRQHVLTEVSLLQFLVCRRSSFLTGEGRGAGEEPKSYDRGKGLVLCKSFNTLWYKSTCRSFPPHLPCSHPPPKSNVNSRRARKCTGSMPNIAPN
jgi:hypothetical protein